MDTKLRSIQAKLNSWRLGSSEADLIEQIYKLIFTNNFYEEIWDEPILRGLSEVIECHPPDREFYGAAVTEIAQRQKTVRTINDIFFTSILGGTKYLDVLDAAAANLNLEFDILESCVRRIQNSYSEPPTRVEPLAKELIELTPQFAESIRRCFEVYQARQEVGMVNGLFVKGITVGIVLPVRAKIQVGTGKVEAAVPTEESFVAAVSRARVALNSKGWLSTNQDIIVTPEETDVSYMGSSVSLPSLAAIYSSARGYKFDPFTAFTGNINQRNNQWRILRVEGILQKLAAAKSFGIRRVILPAENKDDVPERYEGIELVFANGITELFSSLTLPHIESSDTIQQQKILEINTHCLKQGWQLTAGKKINDALQFTITPPVGGELTLTIYNTGTHYPKVHQNDKFRPLLQLLSNFDAPDIPVQSVQQIFNVKEATLREQIRKGFETLGPTEMKQELYCDYSYVYELGNEKLVVKQYASGKLQLQGRAGRLYQKALDIIVPLYNVHFSNASLNNSNFLESSNLSRQRSEEIDTAVELPHIGTDESGKGDYFGPLVVAGVWVDDRLQALLTHLGVRDSKKLSDRENQELALRIRERCQGKYYVVEISPQKYNHLYAQFARERKNLNYLLAWGHARAIEDLLSRLNCNQAIADQFGNERYIRSKLMEKGKTLNLLQTPKAERFIAVAAASVLARDRFLTRLRQLSNEAGLILPKGASPAVVNAARQLIQKYGTEGLRRFAKLHFKTTESVLRK